jgi:hypothetical protein
MTVSSPELTASTTVSRGRRIAGVLRLVAGGTLLGALIFQIVDKVTNNDMIPDQYFAYFTIESAMIISVVLFVGGWMALTRETDTVLYTTIRLSILAYAVVMAGVYNGLLRGIPDEGYVVVPWPGEIMHVWIPLFVLLDWLFSPGRPALRWSALGIVVIYPLAWVAFTLVRGAATGWVPYPFFEFETGFVSIAAYILGIAAFILAVAALGIRYSRRRAPRSEAGS